MKLPTAHCTREPPPGEGGVLCVFTVQNERLRLPDFLRHHRALGVRRFLAIDDNSSDGTREMLLAQSDVTVFEVDSPYSESLGSALWKNALLDRGAVGRWAVVADWGTAAELGQQAAAFLASEKRRQEASAVLRLVLNAADGRGDDDVARNCTWHLSWMDGTLPDGSLCIGDQLVLEF